MLPDKELIRCELLIVACKRGDATATTELVLMFERPLLYYLRRLEHFTVACVHIHNGGTSRRHPPA